MVRAAPAAAAGAGRVWEAVARAALAEGHPGEERAEPAAGCSSTEGPPPAAAAAARCWGAKQQQLQRLGVGWIRGAAASTRTQITWHALHCTSPGAWPG